MAERFAPLSDEHYAALVAAFEAHPGDFAKVARLTGRSYHTCRKAWERGLDGRLPLCETIGGQVVEAAEDGSLRSAPAPAVPPRFAGQVNSAKTELEEARLALGETKAEAVRIAKSLRGNAQLMNAQALVLGQPTLELTKTVGEVIRMQADALRAKWAAARARGEVLAPEALAVDIVTCLKLHQQVSLSSRRAVEAMRAVVRTEIDLFGPGGLAAFEETEAARQTVANDQAEEHAMPAEEVAEQLRWAAEQGPPELKMVVGGDERG